MSSFETFFIEHFFLFVYLFFALLAGIIVGIVLLVKRRKRIKAEIMAGIRTPFRDKPTVMKIRGVWNSIQAVLSFVSIIATVAVVLMLIFQNNIHGDIMFIKYYLNVWVIGAACAFIVSPFQFIFFGFFVLFVGSFGGVSDNYYERDRSTTMSINVISIILAFIITAFGLAFPCIFTITKYYRYIEDELWDNDYTVFEDGWKFIGIGITVVATIVLLCLQLIGGARVEKTALASFNKHDCYVAFLEEKKVYNEADKYPTPEQIDFDNGYNYEHKFQNKNFYETYKVTTPEGETKERTICYTYREDYSEWRISKFY